MNRIAEKRRKTNETEIFIKVNIDGIGNSDINVRSIPFLQHLLVLLSKHSLIDLTIEATGDLQHHITEDIAIVLGATLLQALGEKTSIYRFGFSTIPMDCSLASTSVDISNRPYSVINLNFDGTTVEEMYAENILHFFETLSVSLASNIHVNVLYGQNDHHKAEAAIKSLARSLRKAFSIDDKIKGIPSSKGVL